MVELFRFCPHHCHLQVWVKGVTLRFGGPHFAKAVRNAMCAETAAPTILASSDFRAFAFRCEPCLFISETFQLAKRISSVAISASGDTMVSVSDDGWMRIVRHFEGCFRL